MVNEHVNKLIDFVLDNKQKIGSYILICDMPEDEPDGAFINVSCDSDSVEILAKALEQAAKDLRDEEFFKE